jgi:8-oxo-dGTP pyrophosphatase MutT (NUDIX family)
VQDGARPGILLRMVAAMVTGGSGDAPVFDAATVVLVRDGAAGLECLMLRKTRGQAFGGMWVFPGGRVEEGDGVGLEGARAAAVREAAEETGLVLDADELVPFSHWTPPVDAPRRFATWFFLGGLPPGSADVVVDGGEIGDHLWTTPAEAIARQASGEAAMVPPTWVTLHRILYLPDVATAVADVRAGEIDRYLTRVADLDGMVVTVWAGDVAYESGDLDLPGPRHRLVMDPDGWRFERSD